MIMRQMTGLISVLLFTLQSRQKIKRRARLRSPGWGCYCFPGYNPGKVKRWIIYHLHHTYTSICGMGQEDKLSSGPSLRLQSVTSSQIVSQGLSSYCFYEYWLICSSVTHLEIVMFLLAQTCLQLLYCLFWFRILWCLILSIPGIVSSSFLQIVVEVEMSRNIEMGLVAC